MAQQCTEFRQHLLETESALIVYANRFDLQWGCGLGICDNELIDTDKHKGLNFLGYLLMDLRNEITA